MQGVKCVDALDVLRPGSTGREHVHLARAYRVHFLLFRALVIPEHRRHLVGVLPANRKVPIRSHTG